MATDLIQELGGVQKVSEDTGVARNAVHNWCQRGIPWRWRPRIAEMLREAGKEVPPDFLIPPGVAA